MSTDTQTPPDLEAELAHARRAVAEAEARKAIADAVAAEDARRADPMERAIDAADAALQQARERGAAAIKSASSANTALARATAAVRALAEAAATGASPDEQALLTALEARRGAEVLYAFQADVQAIAQANVEAAIQHAAGTRDARQKGRLVAVQERLNAEFRALVPNQPDDAVLKAELARNPGLLKSLIREASDAHAAAYSHWAGNAATPTGTPKQRIIQERQDFGAWMEWAVAPEAEFPHGWQDRAILRQARVCIAGRDHFTAYTKLGLDDLRRLHSEDYAALRAKLPKWTVASNAGSRTMIAPGVFAKVG